MRIRLNTIFYFILAIDLFLYLALFDETSEYLNSSSILYYIIFTLCILITIVINGKRKNIFLEMLIGLILLTYHFRIPILFYSGELTTMTGISVTSSLINNKIIELCYHYAALSLAIIVVNPKMDRLNYHIDKHIAKKILSLSSVIILLNIVKSYFSGYGGSTSFMGHFAMIFSVLDINVAMLFVITSIVAAGKNLPKSYKYGSAVLIFVYAVFGLYFGSKAPIVMLVFFFLIARLICYGPIIVDMKKSIKLIMLVALIGVSFAAGNIMRYYQRDLIEIENVVDRFRMTVNMPVNLLLGASSRLGYFDYYVKSSENSLYRPYISFKYYFGSMVDKLTPGFDIFGYPYASRMFKYARLGFRFGEFHSDQMTIFGEASVIFSSLSIIWFFVMIIFFRFLVKNRPSSNSFMNVLYLAIVLYAYGWWLTGYGFDMFFCQFLVYPMIYYFCMLWFCRLGAHIPHPS